MFDARLLFLIFPGVAMVALALWTRHANAKSAQWPATSGRVVTSRLVDGYGPHPDVQIEYTYDVDGANYSCANVGYMARAGSANHDLVKKYRVGSEVVVYYDPASPSRAVLERGPSLGWVTFFVGGLVFVAAGVFLA